MFECDTYCSNVTQRRRYALECSALQSADCPVFRGGGVMRRRQFLRAVAASAAVPVVASDGVSANTQDEFSPTSTTPVRGDSEAVIGSDGTTVYVAARTHSQSSTARTTSPTTTAQTTTPTTSPTATDENKSSTTRTQTPTEEAATGGSVPGFGVGAAIAGGALAALHRLRGDDSPGGVRWCANSLRERSERRPRSDYRVDGATGARSAFSARFWQGDAASGAPRSKKCVYIPMSSAASGTGRSFGWTPSSSAAWSSAMSKP